MVLVVTPGHQSIGKLNLFQTGTIFLSNSFWYFLKNRRKAEEQKAQSMGATNYNPFVQAHQNCSLKWVVVQSVCLNYVQLK